MKYNQGRSLQDQQKIKAIANKNMTQVLIKSMYKLE